MKPLYAVGILVLLLASVGVAGYLLQPTQAEQGEVISQSGIHWHPQLTIYMKGEKQEIPANIGIGTQYASMPTFDPGMRMTAMHTHEPDGTIHLEFSGLVRREDTTLGNFFKIWGKDFGTAKSMMVNGVENAEFESYHMQDGDKIELRYE